MPREPLVFGQPRKSHLFEKGFHLERNRADVGPRDAGAGIEVNAPIRRMIDVG